MNSYSKFKALAGVNSIYYNVTDENYNLVGTIRNNIDSDKPSLYISGSVDNVQRGNIFHVDNFEDVNIVSTDSVTLNSTNVLINSTNSFSVIGPDSSNTIQISSSTDAGANKFAKLNINANAGVHIDSGNNDTTIKGSRLLFNESNVMTVAYSTKLVEFFNKATTVPDDKVVAWEFKVADGNYYDPHVGDVTAGSRNIRFEKTPIMQIVEIATGALKLAEIAFNINTQTVTVILDNVQEATIPINKYKISLLGY